MPLQVPTMAQDVAKVTKGPRIEIAAEYAGLHPIAQALVIGENASLMLRQLVADAVTIQNEESENPTLRIKSRSDADDIIRIWQDMHSIDRGASIRTILNRESKKALKLPLTVKDDQLILAKTRKKPSAADSSGESESESAPAVETVDITRDDDLTRIKRFFVTANDQEKAVLLAVVAKLEEKRNA